MSKETKETKLVKKEKDQLHLIARRRAQLQRELQESVIKPISFEIFKKTLYEKRALKEAKKAYKKSLMGQSSK